MSEKNDSGDKTEAPTPKRIRDARKKGDVAKSKDLTATAGLVAWLAILAFAGGYAGERLVTLFEGVLAAAMAGGGVEPIFALGREAVGLVALLSAIALLPAVVAGILAEFLQTGPLLAFEKLKPKMDHLNPGEGLKRMFSMDNLVELLKTVAKTLLLVAVTGAVIWAALPALLGALPAAPLQPHAGAGRGEALAMLAEHGRRASQLIFWVLAAFLLVAALDMAWQRHSYIKKLRMSLRDIRDEVKKEEGDPHVKGQRRQLHQEWAESSAIQAAAGAHALVVNPTHIAVALDYDPVDCPLPVVAAIGEGTLAAAMRAAAEDAGVPIIRHVQCARDLRARALAGEMIPRDLFEVVAEVIAWARRERAAAEAAGGPQ
jgi:type III secretion protein U